MTTGAESESDLEDMFGTSPAPTDSIDIQSSMATTLGNVDGVYGQTRMLGGALVVRNKIQNITLPNLTGGGSLMQEGQATVTLAGTNNTITGPLYLGTGTLSIAPNAAFASPPTLVVGPRDGSRNWGPVFDISQLTPGTKFVLGGLQTPGYVVQVLPSNLTAGLNYATVKLGQNTLVVGDGSNASTNNFPGGMTGTGGLEIANHSTLALGGIAMTDDPCCGAAIPISTFTGGTSVNQGGVLILQNPGSLGAGGLTNAGTVELSDGVQYNGIRTSTSYGTGGLANHTVVVHGDYIQEGTGNLILKINHGDVSAEVGSGAGIEYENLAASGSVQLDGTLTLQLING
jgi:hypothetical protein